MKYKLLDVLACPNDGSFPLNLHVFEESAEIIEGILVCPKCLRWYPIHEKLPQMLPDEFRDKTEEMSFIKKWKTFFPQTKLVK